MQGKLVQSSTTNYFEINTNYFQLAPGKQAPIDKLLCNRNKSQWGCNQQIIRNVVVKALDTLQQRNFFSKRTRQPTNIRQFWIEIFIGDQTKDSNSQPNSVKNTGKCEERTSARTYCWQSGGRQFSFHQTCLGESKKSWDFETTRGGADPLSYVNLFQEKKMCSK